MSQICKQTCATHGQCTCGAWEAQRLVRRARAADKTGKPETILVPTLIADKAKQVRA